MELRESQNGKLLLTLTTPDEIKIASLVANYDWARYPNIFHPVKRSVHRKLACRAFDAVHLTDGIGQSLSLTAQETAIVAEGVFRLENALLHVDETHFYTTNTLERDATALNLASALKVIK